MTMKHSIICLIAIFLMTGCNLGTTGVTPLPTPDIPTLEIIAPANNQEVVEGFDFDFDIVARDDNPGISLVELYVDELLINFSSPVDGEAVPVFRTTMNWLASGAGLHIVEVIAYRPDGTQGDPARLNIEVVPREE